MYKHMLAEYAIYKHRCEGMMGDMSVGCCIINQQEYDMVCPNMVGITLW